MCVRYKVFVVVSQMYYVVETSRLKHVPGKVIFQEKWLVDLINVKLKFWREVKF